MYSPVLMQIKMIELYIFPVTLWVQWYMTRGKENIFTSVSQDFWNQIIKLELANISKDECLVWF